MLNLIYIGIRLLMNYVMLSDDLVIERNISVNMNVFY